MIYNLNWLNESSTLINVEGLSITEVVKLFLLYKRTENVSIPGFLTYLETMGASKASFVNPILLEF
jgi:hypothetical protein